MSRFAFPFTRYAALLLATALASAGALAAGGDPLQSAACRDALARLHEQESDARAAAIAADTAGRDRALARLKARRVAAARECLAEREDPPPVRRLAQPPLAAAAPSAPSAGRAAAPGSPPPPAPTAPRTVAPPTVTMCDPAGCWLSNGTRLNRVGPLLMGPSGACLVNGTTAVCP